MRQNILTVQKMCVTVQKMHLTVQMIKNGNGNILRNGLESSFAQSKSSFAQSKSSFAQSKSSFAQSEASFAQSESSFAQSEFRSSRARVLPSPLSVPLFPVIRSCPVPRAFPAPNSIAGWIRLSAHHRQESFQGRYSEYWLQPTLGRITRQTRASAPGLSLFLR